MRVEAAQGTVTTRAVAIECVTAAIRAAARGYAITMATAEQTIIDADTGAVCVTAADLSA
ncbi:hypothetical protein [Hyphomicrobium sp. 99]|uniref:hypothetical protein n=1 Tax=Hyphomicrobium sp. 99 TaxID=1163419 RepID=UPI0005F88890|nr:hypothetical protein [Hyphomicrobium sp. 99]